MHIWFNPYSTEFTNEICVSGTSFRLQFSKKLNFLFKIQFLIFHFFNLSFFGKNVLIFFQSS